MPFFNIVIMKPGQPHHRMCLWNGFIAASPGHPVLAKAIKTLVNQVRNRYTSVDVNASFCPNPSFHLVHGADTLFLTDPCLLGASLNHLLGRHGQDSFVPGELNPWKDNNQHQRTAQASSLVVDLQEINKHPEDTEVFLDPSLCIPGCIIILEQSKKDMGSQRFTLLEKNLIVATYLPESNQCNELESNKNNCMVDASTTLENIEITDNDQGLQEGQHRHYRFTHANVGVYGLDKVYVNQVKACEEIRLVVKGGIIAKKLVSLKW